MTISEEINAIRDKNTPAHVKLIPDKNFCRNTYAFSLGECARCGMCGRVFDEKGKLVEEAYEKKGNK